MSATPPTVVPILATPFGVVPMPEAATLNATLTAVLAARAAADTDSSRKANPLCYRSPEDLLEWAEPTVQRVAAEMLRGVYTIVAAVNELDEAQLRSLIPQARCCFAIIRPDGAVPATNHPLTAWCGIYCAAAPVASTARGDRGTLRLYGTRLATMFTDATNSAMRVPYMPGHYAWKPVPGQMAVFPASITHEIGLNRLAGELVLMSMRVRFVVPGQLGWSTW